MQKKAMIKKKGIEYLICDVKNTCFCFTPAKGWGWKANPVALMLVCTCSGWGRYKG